MDTLEMKDIEAAVEGILFASGEPVAVDRICVALNMDRPTVELVLQHLQDYYSYERRGVRLLRMEDSWQLCSAPEYGDQIRKAFEIRKPAKLSQSALEVLTIIAYYQPTTRAYVDQIRGVDSSYTVGLLLDRHLIEECGRLQVPGAAAAVPDDTGIFAGVSSEFAGGAAPAAGNGGRRTAAAGRRYGTGGQGRTARRRCKHTGEITREEGAR